MKYYIDLLGIASYRVLSFPVSRRKWKNLPFCCAYYSYILHTLIVHDNNSSTGSITVNYNIRICSSKSKFYFTMCKCVQDQIIRDRYGLVLSLCRVWLKTERQVAPYLECWCMCMCDCYRTSSDCALYAIVEPLLTRTSIIRNLVYPAFCR